MDIASYMWYHIEPSLEEQSIANLAILLWKHNDDCTSLADYTFFECETNCDYVALERIVTEKISQLQSFLPASLIEKISGLIRPIGLEMVKWKEYQSTISSDVSFIKLSLRSIVWTNCGTIDVVKTAKCILKLGCLDNVMQYKMSCHYCLLENAKVLWEKLSESERRIFLDVVDGREWNEYIREESEGDSNILETVMTFKVLNIAIKDLEPFVVTNAIKNGNSVATDYYMKGLESETIKNNLPFYFETLLRRCVDIFLCKSLYFFRGFYSEIAFILIFSAKRREWLENMSKELKLIIFFLLEHPFQPIFLWILDVLYSEQPPISIIDTIMVRTLSKSIIGFRDWHYASMFEFGYISE